MNDLLFRCGGWNRLTRVARIVAVDWAALKFVWALLPGYNGIAGVPVMATQLLS